MIRMRAMAYRCDLCGRGKNNAHAVSHSNIKTKKQQLPNLRRVRAAVDGRNIKLRVCSRCLRSGRVTKAA